MALSDRVAKYLADCEKCPLKPLAERVYFIAELSFLCDLHTNKGKKYIHVDLHDLILKGCFFLSLCHFVESYLKFMSGTVKIFLEKYELRQRVYIQIGRYKILPNHADVPYQISVMFGKIFRETLFYSPYLILYGHEFKCKELDRGALVKEVVKGLKRARGGKRECSGQEKDSRKDGLSRKI